MRATSGLMFVVIVILAGCAGDDGSEALCGDGVCNGAETPSTCATDCPIGGPRCGDGVCNGNETASSCASDCASPTCSASADTCSGETVCLAGDCVAAFPRVYEIHDVVVSVPTTNPNNQTTWDAGGGAPDLFLSINGTKVTNAVQDQFSATFPGPFDVSLIAGGSVHLRIDDEDLTVNDPAFECVADPLTPAILRGRSLSCSVSGMTLEATIDPK